MNSQAYDILMSKRASQYIAPIAGGVLGAGAGALLPADETVTETDATGRRIKRKKTNTVLRAINMLAGGLAGAGIGYGLQNVWKPTDNPKEPANNAASDQTSEAAPKAPEPVNIPKPINKPALDPTPEVAPVSDPILNAGKKLTLDNQGLTPDAPNTPIAKTTTLSDSQFNDPAVVDARPNSQQDLLNKLKGNPVSDMPQSMAFRNASQPDRVTSSIEALQALMNSNERVRTNIGQVASDYLLQGEPDDTMAYSQDAKNAAIARAMEQYLKPRAMYGTPYSWLPDPHETPEQALGRLFAEDNVKNVFNSTFGKTDDNRWKTTYNWLLNSLMDFYGVDPSSKQAEALKANALQFIKQQQHLHNIPE